MLKWVFDVTEKFTAHIVWVLIKYFWPSWNSMLQLKYENYHAEMSKWMNFSGRSRLSIEKVKGQTFVMSWLFSVTEFLSHLRCSLALLVVVYYKAQTTLESREKHNFLADYSSDLKLLRRQKVFRPSFWGNYKLQSTSNFCVYKAESRRGNNRSTTFPFAYNLLLCLEKR